MMQVSVGRRATASLAAAIAATLVGSASALAAPGLQIDVTTLTNTKSATASVGDTLTLKVYAVVTGSDANGANDGVQNAQGSFLSTGGMKGTLSASLINPFIAVSSQAGSAADLDADGDLDVGSNVN